MEGKSRHRRNVERMMTWLRCIYFSLLKARKGAPRLQTVAIIRPRPTHTEFTWPSSLQQPTTATSATDLGISEQEASEVRRMVQVVLERS